MRLRKAVKTRLILLSWMAFLLVLTALHSGHAGAAEALNVRLVGQSDLQGRDSLQVVLKGNYAYVGHHAGEELNPLTGMKEPNGTSILDVSDPLNPRILVHIPGHPGAESRAVQVVEKFHDGRDYLLRNQESAAFTGFEVWDITSRRAPHLVSTLGPLGAAHKSWWDARTGHAYLSGILPGWRGQHLIIYDLRNPHRPRFVSAWGLPGQRPGETGAGKSLHHPVIAGDRAYLSYLGGGDVVLLDISDKERPRMISHLEFSPPFSGTHTTVPFNGLRVPNFTPGYGDVRNVLVVSEEAISTGCRELRRQLYIVDATDESHPLPVSTFKVPDGDFCDRGGRFGPHQFAETRDGEIVGGTLLFVAYFNAGLRVVDIADPFRPKEVGYYIPDGTGRTRPLLRRVIQTNDVDLDHRGLIYITDRAGAGLHVLEYTGK
jgi:hypothetical protein